MITYTIKPLVWQAESGGVEGVVYYWANALRVAYHIKKTGNTITYGTTYKRTMTATTVEEAKASCQAHYENDLTHYLEKHST